MILKNTQFWFETSKGYGDWIGIFFDKNWKLRGIKKCQERCTKLVYLISYRKRQTTHIPWSSCWLMIQLTNGQHTCELMFKPKADILNIRRNYQFVFSVLDELYASHYAWCSRCCSKSALWKYEMWFFLFSQGSVHTIFRWGGHSAVLLWTFFHTWVKNLFLFTNASRSSAIINFDAINRRQFFSCQMQSARKLTQRILRRIYGANFWRRFLERVYEALGWVAIWMSMIYCLRWYCMCKPIFEDL